MEQQFKEWVASLANIHKRSKIIAAIKVNGELLLNNYFLGKKFMNLPIRKNMMFFSSISVRN